MFEHEVRCVLANFGVAKDVSEDKTAKHGNGCLLSVNEDGASRYFLFLIVFKDKFEIGLVWFDE